MTAFDPVTSHPPFTLPVTQISGQNSLEFIRAVFDHYDSGRVFAITKPEVSLPFPSDAGDVLDLPTATAVTVFRSAKSESLQ